MGRLWTGSDDNPLLKKKILVAASSPLKEAVSVVLEGYDITPRLIDTPEEAVHELKFQPPDFLILEEKYSSTDDQPEPLLDYIQNMSAPQRRELFVVYICRTAKSGDSLAAFSQSVNLVLHPDMLQDLLTHLTESWVFWKELYQVYIQSRAQMTGL